MPFKQLFGNQGNSAIQVESISTGNVVMPLVIHTNTCPVIKIVPVGEIFDNWNNESVDTGGGFKFNTSIEFINIFSDDYVKYDSLISMINYVKQNPRTLILRLFPYYSSNDIQFSFRCLVDGEILPEYFKAFLNAGQKLQINFKGSDVLYIPRLFSNNQNNLTIAEIVQHIT